MVTSRRGAGGAVPDGKGGRLIVAHPQEMILPARAARSTRSCSMIRATTR
jgi:hypothetical protein